MVSFSEPDSSCRTHAGSYFQNKCLPKIHRVYVFQHVRQSLSRTSWRRTTTSRWSCPMRCPLTPGGPLCPPERRDQVAPASRYCSHTHTHAHGNSDQLFVCLRDRQVSGIGLMSGVSYRYHFLDSLGRPRTVLCHTMGKLVVLAKFCVTAMVVSRLRTTCHQPPADTQPVRIWFVYQSGRSPEESSRLNRSNNTTH